MQELLRALVERLRKAHGDNLVSVILYGSAVTPGEHDREYSDLNVLCVLTGVAPPQLAASQPVFLWWKEHAMPAPLLLSAKEVAASADCFPIEFRDMQHRRRVLFGIDVIENLVISPVFYRAQVEYELRSKLLRLRQKAAGMLSDRKLLTRLLLDSVTTFCVLARHALLLSGAPPAEVDDAAGRRAVLALATAKFSVDPQPFLALLDVREKKSKPAGLKPDLLFASYLLQIEKIIDAVDAMEVPVAAGA